MAAERMDADADDPDVVGLVHRSASAVGANAYVTTASGTAPGEAISVSSIGIPI